MAHNEPTDQLPEGADADRLLVSDEIAEGADGAPDEVKATKGNAAGLSIVGVGASAGGLEALRALVSALTFDNVAFVVVQHLSPTKESQLAPILSRSSPFRVITIKDGMLVEPNCVYVTPPNADLAILQGRLHLMPARTSPALPIDYFLRSLAQDQGSQAIGIILSGTGTDGTFGLKAIKEAGGITFAQDPATASFDGMPRSAFESGWADFSLPPEGIAEHVCDLHRHPYLARKGKIVSPNQGTLAKILLLVRDAIGTDLIHYKTTTIERRIERRLALHKLERLDDYLRFLQEHPAEVQQLYKDLLIGVTSFFRDGEPFEALKATALPAILANRRPGQEIRVWVPACSTGEEAYSIAMCLLEFLGECASEYRIQVFGTDLDEHAIQRARRGTFPANIALDVSPERLARFFVKKDGEYHISRRIRDMVVFSTQNVLKDPPFSRLCLVSCRNLFIYLQPAMQQRVLRLLHYALIPSGFLMLGTSETVGDAPDLFSLVDRKAKLYVAKHVSGPSGVDFAGGVSDDPSRRPHQALVRRPMATLASVAEKKMLQLYGPPGIIVNEAMEVIHFQGQTARYLAPPAGTASLHLLKLARPELHLDLRRLVHDAFAQDKYGTAECRLRDADRPIVQLEAFPLTEPESKARCVLLVFHEGGRAASGKSAAAATAAAAAPADVELEEVQRELLQTREYLQSTIEDLESANEELKSSNEELQSSNEELQSTNEELQTSKEELQSSNEELGTVNDELVMRMRDEQVSNDDLHNLLAGVSEIVLMADLTLCLRRFTVSAEKAMGLTRNDLGQRLDRVRAFFRNESLEQIARRVIDTLVPEQREITCADEHSYVMRVAPFKTLEHSISGVVIVLTDIQYRTYGTADDALRVDYCTKLLNGVLHPVLVVDQEHCAQWANEAYCRAFATTREQVTGARLASLGNGIWADPELEASVTRALREDVPFTSCAVNVPGAEGQTRIITVGGQRIPAFGRSSALLLLSFNVQNTPILPVRTDP